MEWISIYKTDPIPNKEYLVEGSGRYYIAECNSGTWYELEEYKSLENIEFYCEIIPPKEDIKPILLE